MATLTPAFVFCFWFMPETPQYLASKNKIKAAEYSLRYYRNIRSYSVKELNEDLQYELKKLQDTEKTDKIDTSDDDTAVTWADFGKLINI